MYKSRLQVITEMIAELQGMIPDVYVGEDGVLRIILEVEAGQFENAFLSNQLVLNDLFIQTASLQGLIQHGSDLGVNMKTGTFSTGTITFEGQGGTYIPINSEVAYNAGAGTDPLYFLTTLDGTIPNPGTPSAPVAALGAAGGLTGTYEYRVTFVTASGETLASADSNAITPSSQQVNLTSIPIGGTGTTKRRIYRDKNGAGDYRLVSEIVNNTATTFTDNISDATVAGSSAMPTVDTAHRVTVDARSSEPGTDKNILPNTITELVDTPPTLTGVVASSAFTGGTEDEDTEDFRQRLLSYSRNPQTGSVDDLENWALSVSGVETAAAFSNNNMGVAANGHATVLITTTDGAQPSSQLISDVLTYLQSKDVANITLHVGGFTATPINVTVDVTTDSSYTLADVTPSVQQAVMDYINSIAVGDDFVLAGVVQAVMNLPTIVDARVTSPSSNQSGLPTQKFTAGTITVT